MRRELGFMRLYTVTPEEKEKVENDMEKFVRGTNRDSDLVIVLKGHIFIEHELEEMLKIGLKEPEVIFKRDVKIGFETKLNWAVAIGILPVNLRSAYAKLNTLRNNYAHKLDVGLTERDLKSIEDGLNKDAKKMYKSLIKNEDKEDLKKLMRWIISVLWLFCRISVYEYKQDQLDEYDAKKKSVEWKIGAAEYMLSQELSKDIKDKDKLKSLNRELRSFERELKQIESIEVIV